MRKKRDKNTRNFLNKSATKNWILGENIIWIDPRNLAKKLLLVLAIAPVAQLNGMSLLADHDFVPMHTFLEVQAQVAKLSTQVVQLTAQQAAQAAPGIFSHCTSAFAQVTGLGIGAASKFLMASGISSALLCAGSGWFFYHRLNAKMDARHKEVLEKIEENKQKLLLKMGIFHSELMGQVSNVQQTVNGLETGQENIKTKLKAGLKKLNTELATIRTESKAGFEKQNVELAAIRTETDKIELLGRGVSKNNEIAVLLQQTITELGEKSHLDFTRINNQIGKLFKQVKKIFSDISTVGKQATKLQKTSDATQAEVAGLRATSDAMQGQLTNLEGTGIMVLQNQKEHLAALGLLTSALTGSPPQIEIEGQGKTPQPLPIPNYLPGSTIGCLFGYPQRQLLLCNTAYPTTPKPPTDK